MREKQWRPGIWWKGSVGGEGRAGRPAQAAATTDFFQATLQLSHMHVLHTGRVGFEGQAMSRRGTAAACRPTSCARVALRRSLAPAAQPPPPYSRLACALLAPHAGFLPGTGGLKARKYVGHARKCQVPVLPGGAGGRQGQLPQPEGSSCHQRGSRPSSELPRPPKRRPRAPDGRSGPVRHTRCCLWSGGAAAGRLRPAGGRRGCGRWRPWGGARGSTCAPPAPVAGPGSADGRFARRGCGGRRALRGPGTLPQLPHRLAARSMGFAL